MKNNTKYVSKTVIMTVLRASVILILSLFSLGLNSCADRESAEPRYSCDPQVEKYVVDNLASFSDYKRSDFLKLDYKLRKPVFRALSERKKAELWADKFRFEIEGGKWTSDERAYIAKFAGRITPDLYSEAINDEASRVMFLQEADVWAREGMKRFGWTPAVIQMLAGDLRTVSEVKRYVAISKTLTDEPAQSSYDGPGLECNCNPNQGVIIQDCDPINPECSGRVCSKRFSGCGYFYVQNCSGFCLRQANQ